MQFTSENELFKIINVIIYDLHINKHKSENRITAILSLIGFDDRWSNNDICKQLITIIKPIMDIEFKYGELVNMIKNWTTLSQLPLTPTPLNEIGEKQANYLYYHCDLKQPDLSIAGFEFDRPLMILNVIACDIRSSWRDKVEWRLYHMIEYTKYHVINSPRKDTLLLALNLAIDKWLEVRDGRAIRNIWENASGMSIETTCNYDLTESEIEFLVSQCDLIAPHMSVAGYQSDED